MKKRDKKVELLEAKFNRLLDRMTGLEANLYAHRQIIKRRR